MGLTKWIFCLALTFSIAFSLYGQSPLPPDDTPKAGWLLKAGIGLTSIQTKDQTKGRTEDKIDSYDEEPKVEETHLPLPTLQLFYHDRAQSGHWLFGIKRRHLIVQRRQKTDLGAFTLEAGVNLFGLLKVDAGAKEYQNPYLLGKTREKTGKGETSQSIGYSFGKRIGFSLRFKRDDFKLTKDETPEVDAKLGRNGYRETRSAGLKLWLLNVGYDSVLSNTRGEADSYRGFNRSGSLMLPLFAKGLILMINGVNGEVEYESTHPIFDKIRKDSSESRMLMLMYKMEERTLQLMVLQKRTDSNIDFFDTSTSLMTLGAIWEF